MNEPLFYNVLQYVKPCGNMMALVKNHLKSGTLAAKIVGNIRKKRRHFAAICGNMGYPRKKL
jgi:hypothetical protein